MSHPKDQQPEHSATPDEALETEALDEVVGGKRSAVQDAHDKYANADTSPG